MKTTIKTLPFLFAAVAFTACTNESIESIRPATQSQSATVRPDTSSRIFVEEHKQSPKALHGKMMISDELNQSTLQPETTVESTPHTVPVTTPRCKLHLDVMPVELLDLSTH